MCLTCDVVAGKTVPAGGVIYRDDCVVVHHCLDVDVPGYLVISPVRHVEGLGDLSDGEMNRLSTVVKQAVNAIKGIAGVEKVYIASFGEETAHLHLHIFPRYDWTAARYPEATNSRGQLDGARLLSVCRDKYKIPPEALNRPEIVRIVEYLREKVRG